MKLCKEHDLMRRIRRGDDVLEEIAMVEVGLDAPVEQIEVGIAPETDLTDDRCPSAPEVGVGAVCVPHVGVAEPLAFLLGE